MVSLYDCEKQHNLTQFNLLKGNNVHTNVQARVYVRAKAKRVRAFKCDAYAKKERKLCFQGKIKCRRVELVSWRLAISEIELTYDDTQNVMIIDGLTLPCYFADGFCKLTTETPYTLVWFSDDFVSFLQYAIFLDV